MRTLRDLFGGGDLLHLALVLSLLRVDIGEIHNVRNRMENDFRIRQRMNPISQKVIDDLSELGRYGSISANPFEITAYVLNTETNRNHDNQNQLILDQIDDIFLPNPNAATGEDLDSGVSDVGQMSDTETDGTRSPDNLNFVADFDVLSPASDLGTGVAEQPLASPPIFPDDFDFDRIPDPSFDGFDWTEIESVALQNDQLQDSGRRMSQADGAEPRFFGVDPEPVFDWAEVEADAAMQDLDEVSPRPMDFDPDEEEVENQLIEIDNRLIDLDGSIENIDDGVRHLGEALATAQNDETVGALLDDIDEDVERFLFDDDVDVESGLDMVGIRSDPAFNLFDNWRMDVEPDLDEILSGIASSEASVVVKKEDNEEEPRSPDTEKMKPVTIKQEKIEEEEGERDELSGSASDETNFFEPGFSIKVEEDEDSSSDYSSSGSFNAATAFSHLANHSYAASSDLMFSTKSSSSSSFSYDFKYDGASAMASASPMSFCSDSSRLRESRDERKARQLGIPFSLSDLIDSPMEEFNAMMSNTKLTEEQISLCRDIRRRGKNKVAAQNCRRRKLDLISSLEVEVSVARQQKQMLIAEREQLYRLRQEWSDKLRQLEEAVLRGLNKDAEQFSLQLTPDGQSVRVATRHSSRLTKPARA